MSANFIWAFILLVAALPICHLLRLKCKSSRNTYDGDVGGFFENIFAAAVPCCAIFSAFLVFSAVDDIKSEGVSLETDLNQQYVQNANILSTYSTGFQEQLGVSNLHDARLKGIITAALAGQIAVKDGAAPEKTPLFIALAQAYPNVTLPQYNRLIDYIVQGRAQFRDGQTALLHKLSDFDNWQHTGFLIHPLTVRLLGFPNNLLAVRGDGKVVHGAQAEQLMWHVVESAHAESAFQTGVEHPLAIPQQ